MRLKAVIGGVAAVGIAAYFLSRSSSANDAVPPANKGPRTPSVGQRAQAVLGKDSATAGMIATSLGIKLRVVRENGNNLNATRDRVSNRVNVELSNGIVTRIISIG